MFPLFQSGIELFSVNGVTSIYQTRRAQMKTTRYLLFAGSIMVGLLFIVSPAFAQFGGTMPHNDAASGNGTNAPGQCTSHVVLPKTVAAAPQYFKFCVGNSGATEWEAEVRKIAAGSPLICKMNRVAVGTQSVLQCNITQTGNYKSTINYWVNGIQGVTHLDQFFVK
jgi:hypothetical protein